VGGNRFGSTFKDAAFKKDAAVTFEASDAYISTESDYLPLIATAGVFFLEADHIIQLYLHNSLLWCKASQVVVDLVT